MKYTKEEKERFIALMKDRFGSDVQELPTFGLPVKDIEFIACAPARGRKSYVVFTVGAPGTRSEAGVEVHQEFLIELPESWMMPAPAAGEDNILKSSPEQLLAHLFLPIAMRIKASQGGRLKRWGVYDLDGYVKHAPAAHDYSCVLFCGALSDDEDELDFDLGTAKAEVLQMVPLYDEERDLYFDSDSSDFDELFYPECRIVSVRRRCFARDPDISLVDFEFAADSLEPACGRRAAVECWAAAAAGFALAAVELCIADESAAELYSEAERVFAGGSLDPEALRGWMKKAEGRLSSLSLVPIGAQYAGIVFGSDESSLASRFAGFVRSLPADADAPAAAARWILGESEAIKDGFRTFLEEKIRRLAAGGSLKAEDGDAVVRTTVASLKMGRLPDVMASMPSRFKAARSWLAVDERCGSDFVDVPAAMYVDCVNELGADAASCLGGAPAGVWACTRSRGFVQLPFKIVRKKVEGLALSPSRRVKK